MKPAIRAKLDEIFSYPFFQSCGHPLPNTVTAAANWEAAINECTSIKWENCRLMARNALARVIEERAWSRAQEWNAMFEEIRPLRDTFVYTLVRRQPIPGGLAATIQTDLLWDIMGISLEHECRDIVEPFFYLPHVEPWYAAGHLPCGWDGEEFPPNWDGVVRSGRAIVY
jgi:hypothetical protein